MIQCRLVVVQMSSTRADIFNPLLLPLLGGALFDGIFQRVYLCTLNWKIVFFCSLIMHLHYGVGVVSFRNINCEMIKTEWLGVEAIKSFISLNQYLIPKFPSFDLHAFLSLSLILQVPHLTPWIYHIYLWALICWV